MGKTFKAKITLFHCINAFTERQSLSSDHVDVKVVKMPCSGMVSEVFLLKAFEAGADAVTILVCPEGACRYMEGNIRARKRMEKTQSVLDEIGVKGKRLTMHHVNATDPSAVERIVSGILGDLEELGPNPAAL
jgi:coenzyme F420-reducing hydrogenase delta subunit